MCEMMAGEAPDWRWALQGGPITWLVVLFTLLASVGVILTVSVLARTLSAIFVSRRRSSGASA